MNITITLIQNGFVITTSVAQQSNSFYVPTKDAVIAAINEIIKQQEPPTDNVGQREVKSSGK